MTKSGAAGTINGMSDRIGFAKCLCDAPRNGVAVGELLAAVSKRKSRENEEFERCEREADGDPSYPNRDGIDRSPRSQSRESPQQEGSE